MFPLPPFSRLFAVLVILFTLACGHHQTEVFGEINQGKVTRIEEKKDILSIAALAIQSNQVGPLEKLLNEGLLVDTVLENSRTLLIEAVVWQRVDIINLLLKRGARIDLRDREGKTALDHAEGNPALRRALQPQTDAELRELNEAIQQNRFSEVKKLLAQGVEVNVHFANGETPLTEAIQLNSENVVRVILQHQKTDIHFTNTHGETPLAMARRLQRDRIAQLLTKRGATR